MPTRHVPVERVREHLASLSPVTMRNALLDCLYVLYEAVPGNPGGEFDPANEWDGDTLGRLVDALESWDVIPPQLQ